MKDPRYRIIKFEELSIDVLKENNNKVIGVEIKGLIVYLNLKLKLDSKNIIVFSNGALNLKKGKSPVFSRSTWSEDYDASCIYIDDATIHNLNITVGWGVGTRDRYYILDYCEIIKKIANILDVERSNIVLFGSSAGGFMSIMMALYLKGTVAIANNPQVWVRKESQTTRAINLYNSVFENMTEQEIFETYGDRLSVIRTMIKLDYVPKIFYIINRYSTNDVDYQYKPFLEYLDSRNELDNETEIISYHSDNGHSGIYSRQQTAQLINGYFTHRGTGFALGKSSDDKEKQYFFIYDLNNNELDQVEFNNNIYIPIRYLKFGVYASYKHIYSLKKGQFNMMLNVESADSIKSKDYYYEIMINNKITATEDLSQWGYENYITVNNLNYGDIIEIKLRLSVENLENITCPYLKISNIEEVDNLRILTNIFECSSPYCKIIEY